MTDHIEFLLMTNEKEVKESVITKIERIRFGDVLIRRRDLDLIIKVRYTKPKNEKMLTVHLTRHGDKDLYGGPYTKVIFSQDLMKFGYSEWL